MEKQTVITAHIPTPLHEEIKDASKKTGLKVYAIVEQALKLWLESRKAQPQ